MDMNTDNLARWPFEPRHMEVAPEGWRACVEAVAKGYTFHEGVIAFCGFCGNELLAAGHGEDGHGDGSGEGHDIDCLTMRARRMLEYQRQFLVSRRLVPLASSFEGLDMDRVHQQGGRAGG
jgi:hypothetical protein